MDFYQFIHKFLELGIAIMPLYHRSKEPILSTWRHLQERLPSEQEVNSWFATDWNNYGVIAGWGNLVVLDFDNMFYFDLWREWCLMSGTQYAWGGLQVRTRKGMHVYLQTPAPAENDKRISIKGGIDVQAQGKYVVGPLSMHRSGHIYQPAGEMVFPCVPSVESVLPLDLFPRVAHEQTYTGAPIALPTIPSNNADPFVFGAMDLIGKVKASVRIESLYAGVQRSSTDGRWLKALCPFHNDTKQSAWIDTQRQVAGCQVCGMLPMDVINFVSRARGISNATAVTALAEECGVWR